MEIDNDNPSEVNSHDINTKVLELSKKRKLQVDQYLGLPCPKHTCLEESGVTSPTRSSEDSNSFFEAHSEQSVSFSSSGKSQLDRLDSTGATMMKEKCSLLEEESCDESEAGEEALLEYLSQLNQSDHIVQYTEKGIEDILYSTNDPKSNAYALASGRWCIKNDDEPRSRKPTIDQEFEQYFSTLML